MKKFLNAFLSLLLAAQPLFANLSPLRADNGGINPEVFKNARVTDGAFFDGSDLAIWVQDLHLNAQTQKTITLLTDEIIAKTGRVRIYAEGMMEGKADVSVLACIPDERNKEKSINYLYGEGFLSAAEYMALKGYAVYGIEDRKLYTDTLSVLEEIIKSGGGEFKLKISALAQNLGLVKKRYLSKSALKFTSELEKKYHKVLMREAAANKSLLSYYPNLSAYIRAGAQSEVLPAKLNKELLLCLGELKNRISYRKYISAVSGLDGANAKSMMNFYAFLSSETPELLEKYPALDGFFKRRKNLLQINKVGLVFEEKAFAGELAYSNSRSALDRELFKLEEAVGVLKDYASLAVNSVQYRRLKYDREYYGELFNKYFEGEARRFAFELLYDPKRELFYENNTARDKVFCARLLDGMNCCVSAGKGRTQQVLKNLPNYKNVKIIIAGGFHYGIKDALEDKKISYLVLTPEVKDVEGKDKYYDFILYGANSFNKVFHADFDFGSPGQTLNGFISAVSVWGGRGVSARELQNEIERWIASNEKLDGISVSVSALSEGYKITAAYKGASVTADIKINGSGGSEIVRRRFAGGEAERLLGITGNEESRKQNNNINPGLKPLSLIEPFLKTRAQKLLSSMFMPAAESFLWLPMIAASGVSAAPALIMPFVFAFLHNVFKAAALRREGKKYGLKTIISDFAGYFVPSAGLSAVTSLAFWASAFITVNPAIAILCALTANICAHYAYEIYRLSGGTLHKESGYFTRLAEKYFANAHKLNMIEALKEAETARIEEKEIKTFLKPPVGAFVIDGKGNKGRGYNREKSLLHAEYFAFINYLTGYIDKYERNDAGDYTEKGGMLASLLNAAVINAETLNRRVFERNPYLLEAAGFEAVYPKIRTIDDVFNETNLVLRYVNLRLGNPLSDASLYCTLAPCNKCAKIMSLLKIKELVFASPSINKSHKGTDALRQAGVKITEEVLSEEAGEYIENYKVANKSPARTKIASFIQTASRKINGFFDFGAADFVSVSDFGNLFSEQGFPRRKIYGSMFYARPDKTVVRIASAPALYFSSLDDNQNYAGKNIKSVVFTRLDFEKERSRMLKLAPLFTAKKAGAKALFEVYIKDNIFYVNVTDFYGFDKNRAYELAYVRLFEELKEGILSPSVNADVGKLLGTGKIEIIAAEGCFDGETNSVLPEYIQEYAETPANNWGGSGNVQKYELFSQMRSEIEDLKGRFRESERTETRKLFTGASVEINIASLNSAGSIGKIYDIITFADIIKGKFAALNVSGYMPFGKTVWMDDIYIDWSKEALRLSEQGYGISSGEIENISRFYGGRAGSRGSVNNENAAEIMKFEEETAKKLLSKIKGVAAENISAGELRAYRDAVKEMQIKDIVSKTNGKDVDISAEYIYDKTLSVKDNLNEISHILGLFNGIIVKLDAGTLKEISGGIYGISAGKPVAFRLDEQSLDIVSESDISVKKDYGFRVIREFSETQDPYGKVISIPAGKITDAALEKLDGCSAVIISVPEVSGDIIKNLSDAKNGENIISNIMKAAGNIKTNQAQKNIRNYYFHGVNAALKADKTAARALFAANMSAGKSKGRGPLAALNALDADIMDEALMHEIFEAIKVSFSFADAITRRRISVISDRIKKQYENGDERNKRIAAESLKQFLFGFYFGAEILPLPAFEKYEGEYAERAGNYAADARKHIVCAQQGLAFEDTLSNSLKSLYFLIGAEMLSKDELMKLLGHYSSALEYAGAEESALFAAVLGQAAKKYGRKEMLSYSDKIKDKIVSYAAAQKDKRLHITAMASVAYIENDDGLKNELKTVFDGSVKFSEYGFDDMLMAVTLIELLDFDPGLFIFRQQKDKALESVYADSGLAGLYAKTVKLTSSYSASGIEAELESALESFVISPMKRYAVTDDNVKAASIAMALIELCELAGYKNDSGSLKKVVKTVSVSAVRSILSAA